MKWNLDVLYPSFESDQFLSDVRSFKNKINDLVLWCNENLHTTNHPKEKIECYIKKQIEIYTLFDRLFNYASLTLSVDSRNQKALSAVESMEEQLTSLTKPTVDFQKWLARISNIKEIISTSTLLKEHSFYIYEMLSNAKYLLSDKEEVILAKMKNTGSKAWEKLQDLITSTLLVPITLENKEQSLPLPVIRNLAYDKDPLVRKTAYEAELNSYKKIDDSSAAALNGIKGEVITETTMRGYESPLALTIKDSRMTFQCFDAMITAIKEYLPVFQSYLKKKSTMLGHKNGLPFYDLFAPIGKVDLHFTYDKAKDYIIDHFSDFSLELSNFAKMAFENNWIDAKPREGKRGGAFCAGIHSIGESRIMSNFTGSFDDVITLAHELGHAYHDHCLKEESILNSNYPMPIAETASIFSETIILQASIKEADAKTKAVLLESNLMGATQTIVDIYSRYLFETEVFKRRTTSSIPVSVLNELMIEAQIKAYGDGLNHEMLHPYMWICKPHYYSADYNFYNFPYAFGHLFSLGLYSQYLSENRDFVSKFNTLLQLTGKTNLVDVARSVNIDIEDVSFWKSSLDLVAEDIHSFAKL